MTTKEIMDLDLRKTGAKEILQQELKKIKPLEKAAVQEGGGDVPLWALEKMLSIADVKNGIQVKMIVTCPGVAEIGTNLWRMVLHDTSAIGKSMEYDAIYAVSIYECLAKGVLKARSIVAMRGTGQKQ